ncbi:peptidase C14 [filamentous cyanobacterium Phorm 6]|nr:peptidase C14 [filamentous cyanobacterium Phorm 6]
MSNNWAIAIGINYYEHLHESKHLKYAVRDADSVKNFLCNQAGFCPDNVVLCSDNSEPIGKRKEIPTHPNRSNLRRLLRDEIVRAKGADNLWLFFSGHGMLGRDNHDYLMPRDGYYRDLEGTAISIDFVIRCLMECQSKNVVLALDMCRNEDVDGSKGVGDLGTNTAKLAKQQGIITIFSCHQGERSYEIPELQQGAFTHALLEGLTNHKTPRSLEQYLQQRLPQLNREYRKPPQFPQISLNSTDLSDAPLLLELSQQVSLRDTRNLGEKISIPPASRENAKDFGYSPIDKLVKPLIPGTPQFAFEVVTVDFQGIKKSSHSEQTQQLTEELGNGVTLEMVVIPGGTFLMGAPKSKAKSASANDEPQHSVTVQPFLIGKYPITKAQWKEVASLPEVRQNLKLRPSRCGGKSHPVTEVSWYDAVEFCERLSQKTGYEYRLPSEAEWEYACRAGTTTPFHFGETITTELANYDGGYTYDSESKGINLGKAIPVRSFRFANAFGLFDMHGNVWEWCLDHWHENYNNAPINGEVWLADSQNQTRVIRGGSWHNEPSLCRSTYRHKGDANCCFKDTGFRIVRSL